MVVNLSNPIVSGVSPIEQSEYAMLHPIRQTGHGKMYGLQVGFANCGK